MWHAGPKKHLKRLNAPKHWMLDKLSGIFVSAAAQAAPATACSAQHDWEGIIKLMCSAQGAG